MTDTGLLATHFYLQHEHIDSKLFDQDTMKQITIESAWNCIRNMYVPHYSLQSLILEQMIHKCITQLMEHKEPLILNTDCLTYLKNTLYQLENFRKLLGVK